MASRWLGSTQQRRPWVSGQQLLRLLVIAGVLLASYLMAGAAVNTSNPVRLLYHPIILLVAGGTVALVFIRWPALGLVSVVIASLVAPISIGTGSQSDINATILVLGLLLALWLLDMVIIRRQVRLAPSAANRPLLAFLLVSMISFGVGQLPWFNSAEQAPMRAQIGGLGVFLLSTGAFLLVANQVKSMIWLQRLTGTFLALGGLLVVGWSVPGLGQFVGVLFQPGSTGSLFWMWLVALAFGQALFNRQLSRGWRLALLGIVLGAFYIGLIKDRGWTSGWLPGAVAVGVIVWLGKPQWRPLAVLGACAVALLYMPKIMGLLTVGDNEYSLLTRLAAWQILFEIVKVNPVLGLGPANYYWYTPLFPILGYTVQFNSHNNYMDIIAQTGFLGLACFIWFAVSIGRLGWQLRTRVPEGFAQAYVYSALGGLVGTLVAAMLGDWVLPFVYNIGLTGLRASVMGWLFLGGLVALDYITHTSPSQAPSPVSLPAE